MKTCITCKETLAYNFFGKNVSVKDGYNRKCKECYRAYQRDWYAKNVDVHQVRVKRWKEQNIGYRYGLKPDEFNLLKDKFGGLCYLCKTRKGRCIDHNHQTGKIRGWLCGGCNSGIGFLGDSIVGLQNAIQYLQLTDSLPSDIVVNGTEA